MLLEIDLNSHRSIGLFILTIDSQYNQVLSEIVATWDLSKDHFPLGGIFHAERHFLLFKDQLAKSGRQKTKEIIVPR